MSAPIGQVAVARARGSRLDLYAAGLSMLCLVHCLAVPLLASLLPLAGQLVESAFAHRALALLAAPATLWVSWKAVPVREHRSFIPVAPCGLGLLLISAFVAAVAAYERPLTVAGALLLASAHLSRWAQHRHQERHPHGHAQAVPRERAGSRR